MTTSPNLERTITVTSDLAPIQYRDLLGTPRSLGTVVEDTYGDENLRRLRLLPSQEENPWAAAKNRDSGYDLGIGGSRLEIPNPIAIQDRLTSEGWELKKILGTGGGSSLSLLYVDPTDTIDDVYTWDYHQWENRPTGIMNGIVVDVNLMVGRMAVRMQHSLFRMICRNGIIGSVLGLQSLQYRHNEWSQADDGEWVGVFPRLNDIGMILGRELTSPAFFEKILGILGTVAASRRSKMITDQDMVLSDQFPIWSPQWTPTWAIEDFVEQGQEFLASGSTGGSLTSFDLLNLWTGAINLHGSSHPRGQWNTFVQGPKVVESIEKMSSVLALLG